MSAGDRFLEPAIGRGDDPYVHADVSLAAQSGELAVLQDMEQLRLKRGRHLADLVEKDRSVVGELEFSRFRLQSSAECASLEAEHLRFEQVSGEGGAVDLDERFVAPGRKCAERSCDELFASPTLSANQNGRVGVRHQRDELANLDHRRALPQQFDGRVLVVRLGASVLLSPDLIYRVVSSAYHGTSSSPGRTQSSRMSKANATSGKLFAGSGNSSGRGEVAVSGPRSSSVWHRD